MRRLKDAFEKPFRNLATSSLSLGASQPRPVWGNVTQLMPSVGATTDPIRDTERDLDCPVGGGPEPESLSRVLRKARSPSPVWDIELDLNESGEEEGFGLPVDL